MKAILRSLGWGIPALLLAACLHDAPLAVSAKLPLDAALPGVWRSTTKEGSATLRVLRWSDTEYLAHWSDGNGHLYYRGYPIEVAGVPCVQLCLVGTGDGPPDVSVKPYQVVSYRLEGERLTVSNLNPARVGGDLSGTEALRAAFERAKDAPDLFIEPTAYTRVEAGRIEAPPR